MSEQNVEVIRRACSPPSASVIVATHQSGRGKQSGVEVEAEFLFTFKLRDGQIAEWRIFLDEGQALAATASGG